MTATARRGLAYAARIATVCLLFAGALALRGYAALTLPINSDEPQHLHVSWAWTQGLVPYRDVFDNHAPLFQLLCAPLLAAFGERADIVPMMRLAMIPLYFCALWLVWYIGRVLWSARVGWVAATLVATAPVFFRTSAEFRPDVLWMVLWLATVAAAVSPAVSRRRPLVVGLLAGATFAVSLKTVLLAGTGLAAWVIIAALDPARNPSGVRAIARQGGKGFLAALVVPVAIAVFFAQAGAAQAAMYCLFGHNLVLDLGRWQSFGEHLPILLIGAPVSVALLWKFRPTGAGARAWLPRAWLMLSAVLYVLSLYGAWPLVTRQDLLPVVPLLGIGIAALAASAGSHPALRYCGIGLAVLAACADAGTIVSVLGESSQALAYDESELQRILRLTRADDYVMDAKGFAIFRRRPVYWVLEGITERRMKDGSIADDIAARLAATATPLVVGDRLPEVDAAFVSENYLCIGGRLRILGQRLAFPPSGDRRGFDIEVPASYLVVDRNGPVSGSLDGQPIDGARLLARGRHVLKTPSDEPVAIVWSPAVARGLAPASLIEERACVDAETFAVPPQSAGTD
jgi:hypothetical protein